MRRRFKTRRRNKQRKIIIISACSLLLIMTVGYATMQTNLSIKAKGNVLQNTIDITDNIVDSGDGLYIDTYEEGRYVYKGANPNNYISFNNELWRIISKESDGTYKIIRNEVLEDSRIWSDETSCPITYNSVRKNNNTTIVDNIVYLAPDPMYMGCNKWEMPTELNTYLNDEYYNELNVEAQEQIVNHIWNIGAVIWENTDLVSQVNNEQNIQWSGNVGLITSSDFIKANSNISQCGNFYLQYNNYEVCPTTNWMPNNDDWWTITARTDSSNIVYVVNQYGCVFYSYSANIYEDTKVRPVVYLSSDIKIVSGTGTETDAYQIEL